MAGVGGVGGKGEAKTLLSHLLNPKISCSQPSQPVDTGGEKRSVALKIKMMIISFIAAAGQDEANSRDIIIVNDCWIPQAFCAR